MMSRPGRDRFRGVGPGLGIFLAAFCFTALLASPALPKLSSRGEALFFGRERLQGRIRGHERALPPEAVRCRNCHVAAKQATDPVVTSPSAAAALRIDRSWLIEPRPRRGGPPSSYDRPAFCRVLRTGIDPAYVLIAREMPIYNLDDAACAHLWAFVTAE